MEGITRRRALASLAALPALAFVRPAGAAWTPDPRSTLDLWADYGVAPGQDATSALNAFALANGPKQTLSITPGNYPVAGAVAPLAPGQRIVGDPVRSFLWPTHPTAALITAASYCKIIGVAINWGGNGTRTTPAISIPAGAGGVEVANVDTSGLQAVDSNGPTADVHDCSAAFPVLHPNPAFSFGGASIATRAANVRISGAGPNAGPAAGIRITNGGVTLIDPYAQHAARGIEVIPGPGQTVASLGVHSTGPDLAGMDLCWDTGIYLAPVGGFILRSRITGMWAGGCHYGLVAWGNIDALDLTLLDIYGNTEGVLAGPAQNLWMRDSRVAQNNIGLHVAALGRLRLHNSRVGATGGLAANGQDVLIDAGGTLDNPPGSNEIGT